MAMKMKAMKVLLWVRNKKLKNTQVRKKQMNRAKVKPAMQTIPKVWNASDFFKFKRLSSVVTAFKILFRSLKLSINEAMKAMKAMKSMKKMKK